MGGTKKKPISKIEKRQLKEREKAKKKEEKVQRVVREFMVDEELRRKIEKEIARMPCITPSAIAVKYNIRISTAKRLLRELNGKGIIRLVDKSPNVTIYAPSTR